MKNTYPHIFLIASLLAAVNTDWCRPSKYLVILSAAVLLISAVKGLFNDELEDDKA